MSNSYVKYTYTATFLFPLVEIPKSIFSCDVKTSFGRTIMTTRFLNAYMWDEDLEFDFNYEPYVLVAVKPYRDYNFEEFYSTIISMENYVDEYEKGNFIIMIFKVPDHNLEYYDTILNGKYSQLPQQAKILILKNNFFSGQGRIVADILGKSSELKRSWENALSSPHPDPRLDSTVSLEGMEVWPIIQKEKEGLCDETLKSLDSNSKQITPNEEFKE
jgi:hypothetical protein